jgi:hypothetical protein
MAKRGQCRCGKVLRFPLTPSGYKTRCTVCHSVVRLRVGRGKNPRQGRAAQVAAPAAPPPLPAPPPWVNPDPGAPYEAEEIEQPDGPEAAPPGGAPWWVLALVFAAIAGCGAVAAALWGWGA